LLADAGNRHRAPAFAGAELRAANPAGAFVVLFALAVPIELDLHAAVFIGVDLFALRSHDEGRLHALNGRAASDPRRTENRGGRDAGERIAVELFGCTCAADIGIVDVAFVPNLRDNVGFAILAGAGMILDAELRAGAKG